MTKSATRGTKVVLQDEVTDGDGLVLAIPDSFKHHTFYIVGSVGISAGAVQPESAFSNDYDGEWAQLGGGPLTVLNDETLIVNYVGVLAFIRCSVTTPIVDGTVTVSYEGS